MGFQQGLSGLNAAAQNLAVIGNNVANANTVGFKESRTQFADIYANSLLGAANSAGIGVTVSKIAQQFSQGNISTSSNPLDMAINGNGFFQLNTNGAVSYTRNGQFELDSDNYIVNTSGGRLQGYPVDSNSKIINSAPTDLRMSTADIAPAATGKVAMVASLNAGVTSNITSTFNVADATTYHNASGISAYDSLGTAHSIQLYFRRTASNVWEVYGSENGTQLGTGPLGTITFDSAGKIQSSVPGMPLPVSLTTTNGSTSPMNFTLDFTGTTQTATNFGVTSITQDGYASGKLVSFSVADDGTVVGRYSNGQTRAQGQVVLASFANSQGLTAIGNNQWVETAASGQPVVGTPTSGNLGTLQSGALEDSNIDLTAELVNMIMAQRTYQANAQTIKTEDAVMQTLVNLR